MADENGFRTTAGPYTTLHRYIKHTCSWSRKKTDIYSDRQTDAAALPGFRGQRSGL